MKIIKKQEFFNWIFQQPYDKPLNFLGNMYDDLCKCPMVAYGVHTELVFDSCSSKWYEGNEVVAEFDDYNFYDTLMSVRPCLNYGELQKELANCDLTASNK